MADERGIDVSIDPSTSDEVLARVYRQLQASKFGFGLEGYRRGGDTWRLYLRAVISDSQMGVVGKLAEKLLSEACDAR